MLALIDLKNIAPPGRLNQWGYETACHPLKNIAISDGRKLVLKTK